MGKGGQRCPAGLGETFGVRGGVCSWAGLARGAGWGEPEGLPTAAPACEAEDPWGQDSACCPLGSLRCCIDETPGGREGLLARPPVGGC